MIELLVVVLIIGILAAAALPQYNKAVEKSRMSEVGTVLSTLQQAASVYALEHGTACGEEGTIACLDELLGELDVELARTTYSSPWGTSVGYGSKHWSYSVWLGANNPCCNGGVCIEATYHGTKDLYLFLNSVDGIQWTKWCSDTKEGLCENYFFPQG